MRDHWKQLLSKLQYREGEKIIDVGGAMDPIPIADVVVDCMDLHRGGKQYCLLDLCSDRFPFPDNAFDICVCSNTLEDLASPRLALMEMSRIAKRGVIEVPHRGPESLKNSHYNGMLRESYSMDEVWHFGTGHHKWLFEKVNGILRGVPKIQFLLMRHPITHWNGPSHIQLLWNNEIPFQIVYDIDEEYMNLDYARFRQEYMGEFV
jgi:ubiquinone/menaquinone biosynthesis C-methylase UbiE